MTLRREYNGYIDRAENKTLYPPLYPFKKLPELVKLIKDAGGFAIIAHPHNQLDDIDYLIKELKTSIFVSTLINQKKKLIII